MPQSLQTEPRKRGRGRPAEALDTRILRLTDRSGECWLWTGRLDVDGYGRITIKKRPARAHRAAYETFVGPIPEGMEIDHLCRVRHCVRPDHLEAVTHRVNVTRSVEATGMIANRIVGATSCTHDRDAADLASGKRCRACRREAYLRATPGMRRKSYTDHASAAQRLREIPGEWQLIATPPTADAAAHMAHYVRTAKRLTSYQPAGAFEGQYRNEDGEFRVYARYVGAEVR